MKELVAVNGTILQVDTSSEIVAAHFDLPSNHGDHLINVFSNDRFYDFILKGRTDLTIIDLGANIGIFSLYASDCAKAIYAVEPTPSHFAVLCELTQNYPNIIPVNAALNDRDGEIDLHIYPGNSTMNSTVVVFNDGYEVRVNGRTLGSLIDQFSLSKVDFVKCDIEGSEMRALTKETIQEVSDVVDSFHVEAHWTPGIAGGDVNCQALMKIFSSCGYDVDMITESDLYASK